MIRLIPLYFISQTNPTFNRWFYPIVNIFPNLRVLTELIPDNHLLHFSKTIPLLTKDIICIISVLYNLRALTWHIEMSHLKSWVFRNVSNLTDVISSTEQTFTIKYLGNFCQAIALSRLFLISKCGHFSGRYYYFLSSQRCLICYMTKRSATMNANNSAKGSKIRWQLKLSEKIISLLFLYDLFVWKG